MTNKENKWMPHLRLLYSCKGLFSIFIFTLNSDFCLLAEWSQGVLQAWNTYKMLQYEIQTAYRKAAQEPTPRAGILEFAFLAAPSPAWKSEMPVRRNKILIKSLHFCTAKHFSTCLTSNRCPGPINICLLFSFSELRPVYQVTKSYVFLIVPQSRQLHVVVFCIVLKLLPPVEIKLFIPPYCFCHSLA